MVFSRVQMFSVQHSVFLSAVVFAVSGSLITLETDFPAVPSSCVLCSNVTVSYRFRCGVWTGIQPYYNEKNHISLWTLWQNEFSAFSTGRSFISWLEVYIYIIYFYFHVFVGVILVLQLKHFVSVRCHVNVSHFFSSLIGSSACFHSSKLALKISVTSNVKTVELASSIPHSLVFTCVTYGNDPEWVQ